MLDPPWKDKMFWLAWALVWLSFVVVLLLPFPALSQNTTGRAVTTCGTSAFNPGGNAFMTITSTGLLCVDANVTIGVPPPTARNFPGCTVGATTTNCLAASTAQAFLQVQNVHASNNVSCAFGVPAVLNAKEAAFLQPGQSASWGPNTNGVPSGQLNCIASAAATPLYLEWK